MSFTLTSELLKRIKNGVSLHDLVRPQVLGDVIGQAHLLNETNGTIRNFIQLGYLPSMILYGPPGVGKTSIARILANEIGYKFLEFNATSTNMSELKEIELIITKENRTRQSNPLRIVLFIDELHRFSSTQQDYLLSLIDSGKFVFIGATSVNPWKRLRRAILSRCQIFELKSLSDESMEQVILKAIEFENLRRKYLHEKRPFNFDSNAKDALISRAGGDGRFAINMVDLTSKSLMSDTHRYAEDAPLLTVGKSVIEGILENAKGHIGLQNKQNLVTFIKLFNCLMNIELKRGTSNKSTTIKKLQNYEPNCLGGTISISGRSQLKTIKDSQKLRKKKFLKKLAKFSKDRKNLSRQFESLRNYSFEELENKVNYSDDSEYETLPIDTGDVFERLNEKSWNSNLDKMIYMSRFYIKELLSNGESTFFILKQLLLFCCTYVDTKAIELNYLVGILKVFNTVSTNQSFILEELASQITCSHKIMVKNKMSDPIRHLRLLNEYFKENFSNEFINVKDTEIPEPEIFFEDSSKLFALQDDDLETQNTAINDFVIVNYDDSYSHLWK